MKSQCDLNLKLEDQLHKAELTIAELKQRLEKDTPFSPGPFDNPRTAPFKVRVVRHDPRGILMDQIRRGRVAVRQTEDRKISVSVCPTKPWWKFWSSEYAFGETHFTRGSKPDGRMPDGTPYYLDEVGTKVDVGGNMLDEKEIAEDDEEEEI